MEDPRKTGLKNGLRQLTIEQLQRVLNYPNEMVLDEYNYEDGKFCPLAVALELDKKMTEPTHEKVFRSLTEMGYRVYNTRGISGEYYTQHRKEDLLEAAKEVLEEKMEEDEMDYDLWHNAVLLVSGANLASDAEIKDAIKGLNKLIGTGYYDDAEGDELLKHIVKYLSGKLETSYSKGT
jgi:hypothetical protein